MDPTGGGPPVVLSGLTKAYGALRAVDGLDLEVGAGQIFGLLGPNGAGKTTTLRLMLGLVRPTAGRAAIFGEPVRAGAPILRRVGALVEQPGFVPHLSGLRNLELFWKAGGEPLSTAHFDEALEIADLGEALRRRYKTYSHGMRQRLGLAQALLGAPDLLVLDEPTTGLDPQQMREIRELVRRVAAGGRTVLLSSHLLAEVEQLCSHVAVMNRGRLVTTGPVDAIVAHRASAYIETTDNARAGELLAGLASVRAVRPEGRGLSVDTAEASRAELVNALVAAGIGVETVTSLHGLEDAFIELLSGGQR